MDAAINQLNFLRIELAKRALDQCEPASLASSVVVMWILENRDKLNLPALKKSGLRK